MHDASFRDPSGYVYIEGDTVKRLIHPIYFKQYRVFTSTGFYQKLIDNRLLIPHQELASSPDNIIIQPSKIPFITYPYEWSFSQYKHAALLTLKIQKFCLQNDVILKDASAFNIAFYKGKPIFIDTLSFDFYSDGMPWLAYKQFISHFLGPLALAKYHGAGFLKNMSNYIDGVPVELISALLPSKTKYHLFLYTTIHLLAKYESKYSERTMFSAKIRKVTKKGQLKIIESLYNYIKGLQVHDKTEWSDYYHKTNYDEASFAAKTTAVKDWTTTVKANTIIDMGGNNGAFARKLNREKHLIVVADVDAMAVDSNYKKVIANKEEHVLPMVLDVLNPSPAIGFNNTERSSFLQRLNDFKPDLCLALALIHHITLSGNVPFLRSAAFFAAFAKYLLIEFPTEEDSQVQFLIHRKGDFKHQFNFYTASAFEQAYSEFFSIIKQKPIKNTHRILYLLKNKWKAS